MEQVIDPTLALTEPLQPTVIALLVRAAEQYPDHNAICKDDYLLSYAQLLEAIARLAGQLALEGIGPGVVVGIHGGKTPGTIISMLGVLCLGAVMLPLDEDLPEARKRIMLEEGKAKYLLLTSNQQFAPAEHIHTLSVDAHGGQVTGHRSVEEQITLLPDTLPGGADPCYIFFTSGTTATPKGIIGCHKGLAHFVRWEQNAFAIGPGDRLAQLASISFDAVLKDIFPPLLNGGTLVLPANRPYENPHQLLQWLDKERITIIQTVPSVVSSWLQAVPQESPLLQTVRLLCLAGEPLPGTLVQNFRQKFPRCHTQIYNLYGPTETTILKSYYRVPDQVSPGILSIGHALPDTQLLILNARNQPFIADGLSEARHFRSEGLSTARRESGVGRLDIKLCAVGELGEIVIRTKFGTLGYCNGSEQDNARFFPNPWRDDPEDIFYRTGDSGRLEPDGAITIAGRLDDQVKIRGMRIQPAEVTATLARYPAIEACVVLPWLNSTLSTPDESALVAYVVPRSRQSLTAHELRQYLATSLPPAMLPATFLFLESIPLQPNGKVDRKALPQPALHQTTQVGAELPTPIQELLLYIWKEVLKKEQIGLHDNFFDLGGHSLLLFQVMARIRRTFNVGVDIRTLFEYVTPARLGLHIEALLVGAQGSQVPPIIAGKREAPLPLSYAERRLWFLHQLEPDSASYTMAGTFRLKGYLDSPIFEACIHELVERHEVLRTVFPTAGDGQPMAAIIHVEALPITYYAGSDQAGRQNEEVAFGRIRTFMRQPFDLAVGPLFRVLLVAIGEDEHLFTLCLHHSIADGWSWEILRREFFLLWQAFPLGTPSPLRPLALQYRDFALWQRQWLNKQELVAQMDYWRNHLAAPLPVLDLPADYPRPAVQTYRGAHHTLTLPSALGEALHRLAREQSVTVFMVLLAAFTLQVARLSGQEDIIIGTDSVGRGRAEVEDMVGFFVNTLALRVHLDGDPTFMQLLQQVREVALAAYTHQDVPFEKIVEALDPERDLSHSPLFQVMFRMSPHTETSWSAAGLEMSQLTLEGEFSKFDITGIVNIHQGGMSIDFEYNTDLFKASRIITMQEQLAYLLEQIVEKPQEHLSAYSLVSASVQSLLPDLTNPLPATAIVPVLKQLRHITAMLPDVPALRADGKTWSYRELLAAVDRLTHQLPGAGIEAGQVIAVQGGKRLYSIVAMIAVLNHGCILLPLDEQLPLLRRKIMLAQSQAEHLVCIGSCETDLAEQCVLHLLDPETGCLKSRLSKKPCSVSVSRFPQAQMLDPAYIFFTSGTTGMPKGILGTQQGVAHFVQWERHEFAIGSGDRVAQLTTFSFDAMLRDLFVPLTSGATLCVPPDDVLKTPASLLSWLEAERISIVHTIPSMLSSWLTNESIDALSLETLRLLFLAGEPLHGTLIQQWSARFPACKAEIINFYGPTETTMIKSFYRVPELPLPWTQPVGSPLPDTQLLILHHDNRPCGIGEVGEIVIRTPFRTLGYLNAIGTPDREFFQNPYRNDPEDLLYCTGDLGRIEPDGTIRVAGRVDDQVKIRGVRVQPAEVAAVLTTCAGVKTCLVLPCRRNDEDEILVAYVICEEPTSVMRDQMREYLAARLPAAMIPAHFLYLETFPLLPNGKIDRAALAQMELSQSEETYSPPQTPLQEQLARLWADLLHAERVGIHDNFFARGGHSLLAALAVTKMRRLFSPDLSLRNLLENPTIAQLERIITASLDEEEDHPAMVCFRSSGEQLPLFCVHPIGGGVLCYLHLSATLGEIYPFYAFQAIGIEEWTRPLADISAMAQSYIQELRKVQAHGPYRLCGWSLGGVIAFEMAQQLRAVGEQISFLGLFDSYAPGSTAYNDITDDALLRSLLLQDMQAVHQVILSGVEAASFSGERAPVLESIELKLAPEQQEEEDALQRRLEVFKAHLQAISQYTPAKTDLSLTLFIAQEQRRDKGIPTSLGWQELAVADVEIVTVPGTHYSILSQVGAPVLVRLLKCHL